MVRRRKIPVRKHHGIRDPLKQLAEKEKRLKNVINNPPDKANDQKPTHKFLQFKKLVEGARSKNIETSTNHQQTTSKQNDATHEIEQLCNESDSAYLRRVNRITYNRLKEGEFEIKYGVNIIRDEKTGKISIKKKPPNEIDELLKQKRKTLKHGKRRKTELTDAANTLDPKTIKELVKQAIREDEEEKRTENRKQIEEYKYDEFKFGETVCAPPNLTALPRKAHKCETVPRPGKKKNLLLQKLLSEQHNLDENNTRKIKTGNKTPSVITKSQLQGKRKDLPIAMRNMLETEREKLVNIYREAKQAKQMANKKK